MPPSRSPATEITPLDRFRSESAHRKYLFLTKIFTAQVYRLDKFQLINTTAKSIFRAQPRLNEGTEKPIL
jgi:hypothetical protein